MTDSIAVAMTGMQNLDALLWGTRWNGTVVTYGFPSAKEDYGSDYNSRAYDHDANPATDNVNEIVGFSALNDTQQQAARSAFNEVNGYVSNLELVGQELDAGAADIRLAMTSTHRHPTAYAISFPNHAIDGDVWFNPTSFNNPQLGIYAYYGFFHEIGHTLGLKHGHESGNGNDTVLAADWDSLEFSIMTYRSYIGSTENRATNTEGHYPQTFMMWDIAALQHMYGADYTTQSGNTTYRFDPATGEMKINDVSQGVPFVNVIFRTIWDGGGTDTYDFSLYSEELNINLQPGGWCDVDRDSPFQAANLGGGPNDDYACGQVFNALLYNNDPRSLIENAIGGAGADIINGNQENNHLSGVHGDDRLYGDAGNDTLSGGPGADAFTLSDGNDTITDFTPGTRLLIDFEGLGQAEPIPNGYKGLTWNNFWSYNDTTSVPGSGYEHVINSGVGGGYNGFGNPASFTSAADFDLVNGYFAAAWNNNLASTIEGWDDGQLVATKDVVLNPEQTFLTFDSFHSIDEVRISAAGGTDAGFGEGTQVAIDDLLLGFDRDVIDIPQGIDVVASVSGDDLVLSHADGTLTLTGQGTMSPDDLIMIA